MSIREINDDDLEGFADSQEDNYESDLFDNIKNIFIHLALNERYDLNGKLVLLLDFCSKSFQESCSEQSSKQVSLQDFWNEAEKIVAKKCI